MVLLKPETSPDDLNSSSVMYENFLEGFTKQHATRLGSEILKNPEDPVYPLVKEYSDVVLKHPPSQLPPDRGVRHAIDLVPGTKYCVTRPLPSERCFLRREGKVGHGAGIEVPALDANLLRSQTERVVAPCHAYNKLNNATVPAQAPFPRKDVLLNNMSGCTLYSALDLVDGCYQIVMRESDIPLTAVSTPSGLLWEPLRTFAQTYFDYVFVHRRLSFFAEYNFRVEYKPGKLNVLADALSRRPDYELAHVSRVTTDLYDRIRLAYQVDENYTPLVQFLSDGKHAKVDRLSPQQRAQLHRLSCPMSYSIKE
ncbi:Pol protein [Phytophthora palmivora]|uniref:Pol protein n=1 Tax=Phytophthora palmivora TaxID=4796 RepID=A0A2P4XAI3_9STRA|nr:Pol protein [Phytophthora palmivora]